MTEAGIIRNQSIDLRSKSMDWFLYDIGLRRERVKDGIYDSVFIREKRIKENPYSIIFYEVAFQSNC